MTSRVESPVDSRIRSSDPSKWIHAYAATAERSGKHRRNRSLTIGHARFKLSPMHSRVRPFRTPFRQSPSSSSATSSTSARVKRRTRRIGKTWGSKPPRIPGSCHHDTPYTPAEQIRSLRCSHLVRHRTVRSEYAQADSAQLISEHVELGSSRRRTSPIVSTNSNGFRRPRSHKAATSSPPARRAPWPNDARYYPDPGQGSPE